MRPTCRGHCRVNGSTRDELPLWDGCRVMCARFKRTGRDQSSTMVRVDAATVAVRGSAALLSPPVRERHFPSCVHAPRNHMKSTAMNQHFQVATYVRVVRIGIASLLLLGSMSTRAESDGDFVKSITAGEKALLPEWCLDTQSFGYGDAWTNTSPRAGHWIRLMGKTFWASHHYCWAQVKMQRARNAGVAANTRAYYLQSAIDEMYYVVNNATSDYVLLPEVLTRMGECYVLQQNFAAANEIFEKARAVKPDYWPPYVRWAEVLVKFGKRQQGLELVEQVLKVAPSDAELQRQYQLLKSTSVRSPKGALGERSAHPGAKAPKSASSGPAAAPPEAHARISPAVAASSATGR